MNFQSFQILLSCSFEVDQHCHPTRTEKKINSVQFMISIRAANEKYLHIAFEKPSRWTKRVGQGSRHSCLVFVCGFELISISGIGKKEREATEDTLSHPLAFFLSKLRFFYVGKKCLGFIANQTKLHNL